MLRKGLAVAVILLFVSVSVIPSTGTTDVKQITMPISSGNNLYVGPSLHILPGCIFGGVSIVSAWIENYGDEDAINVNWSISVKGGILGGINITSKGQIDKIEAERYETVCTDKLIFGLGLVEINVTASAEGVEEVTQQRRGFVILFYVYLQSIT